MAAEKPLPGKRRNKIPPRAGASHPAAKKRKVVATNKKIAGHNISSGAHNNGTQAAFNACGIKAATKTATALSEVLESPAPPRPGHEHRQSPEKKIRETLEPIFNN